MPVLNWRVFSPAIPTQRSQCSLPAMAKPGRRQSLTSYIPTSAAMAAIRWSRFAGKLCAPKASTCFFWPRRTKDQNPAIAAQLMAQAVYGIPELHRSELKEAALVANAGCYATSIILALAPLVRAGLVDLNHGVVCDSKSGVSGAGKQPTQKTHFVEVAENLSAYSVFNHRHTGEILEQLGLLPEQLIFTPHLLPIPRGILSTIYVRLNSAMTAEAIETCIRKFYADSTFVRIFPAGKLPQIQYSLHTNYCDVGFTLAPDGKRLVIVSCLDNLVKGAAGQAVQNMNVMFGWNEEEGLR